MKKSEKIKVEDKISIAVTQSLIQMKRSAREELEQMTLKEVYKQIKEGTLQWKYLQAYIEYSLDISEYMKTTKVD